MTKEDTLTLLMTMETTFSNFHIKESDAKRAVSVWHQFLSEYNYQDVVKALNNYIKSANSAFAPSVSELIGMIYKKAEVNDLNASEAWDKVRQAISRSTYYAKEEFDKLPPIAKKVVGSPDMLYVWATSENFAEGTVMNNFFKSYDAIQKRENELNRVPEWRIEQSEPPKIERKSEVYIDRREDMDEKTRKELNNLLEG